MNDSVNTSSFYVTMLAVQNRPGARSAVCFRVAHNGQRGTAVGCTDPLGRRKNLTLRYQYNPLDHLHPFRSSVRGFNKNPYKPYIYWKLSNYLIFCNFSRLEKCRGMASENCRVCHCSFKTKFGSFSQKEGYLSSENLFKPSNRKDCRGVVLAEVLKKTCIFIERDENFSDRVCNPCARNICNLGSLYTLIEGILQKTPEKRKQHTKRLMRI